MRGRLRPTLKDLLVIAVVVVEVMVVVVYEIKKGSGRRGNGDRKGVALHHY